MINKKLVLIFLCTFLATETISLHAISQRNKSIRWGIGTLFFGGITAYAAWNHIKNNGSRLDASSFSLARTLLTSKYTLAVGQLATFWSLSHTAHHATAKAVSVRGSSRMPKV